MQVHDFFLVLLTILLAARLLGEVAARLSAPPVIGELAAGVVLGPSLLGWVAPTHVIELLAEIGIILLLFEIGLETDIMRLARTGLKSVTVAAGGVVLPFLAGWAVTHFAFGQGLMVSLFVAGTLTATSIGITVRVLMDLRRQDSPEAQVVLGAAVLDDVIGVILLAFLYEFSSKGGINLTNTGKVALFIALFMILAPFVAKGMAEGIRRADRRSRLPGLLPTSVISLVLFFAWLAHAVGAPQLLGGFASGLALSRRFFLPMGVAIRTDPDFAHRVEGQLRPIVHLFTPIFFVTVGLSVDFRAIDWASGFIWEFSAALFVLATLSKLAAAFLIPGDRLISTVIGLAMVPRGEVGLIFAELGRSTGIFDNQVYAALVIVIALTTTLPPFALKWVYKRYGERLGAAEEGHEINKSH